MTRRYVPGLIAALACSSLLGSGCATLHATDMTRVRDRTIASYRSGAGAPTAVFQSGLGNGMSTWSTVIDKLGDSQPIIAYDRPGYGESEKADSARDPCRIAEELHELLHASNVPPPYLLVGHSIGGLYQYAFAKLYPQEVAGLVLLDPTHPQHWKRMQEAAPAMAATVRAMRATVFRSAMRREFDDQDRCEEIFDTAPLVKIPVRLLTRSRFAALERGQFESMVRSLEVDWQSLLGVQQIERVANSGHYIHRDRPDVVVSAIKELLAQVRQTGEPASRPTWP